MQCTQLQGGCALQSKTVKQSMKVCCLTARRVFGNKFAEMPFVATKEGYRREGNCKRLLKVGAQCISACLLCTHTCLTVHLPYKKYGLYHIGWVAKSCYDFRQTCPLITTSASVTYCCLHPAVNSICIVSWLSALCSQTDCLHALMPLAEILYLSIHAQDILQTMMIDIIISGCMASAHAAV